MANKSTAEELSEKYLLDDYRGPVPDGFELAINEVIERCAAEAEALLRVHPIAGSCAARIRALKS